MGSSRGDATASRVEESGVAEWRLQRLIDQAPLGMHVFKPDGTSLLANRAWNRLWNLDEGDSPEGRNIFDDERVRAAGLLPHVREAVAGGTVTTPPLRYEPAKVGVSGEPRWVRAFCYPTRDRAGKTREVTLIIEDVSERKHLEDGLAHRAFHDDLTGLPNRALLSDRLEHALARAGRGQGSSAGVGLLFLDLDDFKHINDSLGHDAGDELLVEVAERLGQCVRPEDTVARLGGDEFVVLLEDLGGAEQAGHVVESLGGMERAKRVAERIAGELRPSFRLGGGEVFVTASIGVVLAGTGGGEAEGTLNLLRRADVAMYAAKEAGRNRYVVFESSMDGRSAERLSLETGLRRALERGEFVAVYQPVVDTETGRSVDAEALVRWRHPERGLVFPAEFVPLAEETGLIVEIGEAVLREACATAVEWQASRSAGDEAPTVWVNLSARQLYEPNLPTQVAHALEEAGLEPGSLGLEITESVAMDDVGFGVERTASILRHLRDLGVRIAVDDFGTGYSSLSYLKRLPVDVLKIDRSFVAGLGRDAGDEAIVRAMVTLAMEMGLTTVAEGVETQEQLEVLRGMGCRFAQGYHLARPLPPGEALDYLRGREQV